MSPGSRCFRALFMSAYGIRSLCAEYIPAAHPIPATFHRPAFSAVPTLPSPLLYSGRYVPASTRTHSFCIHKGILLQELVEECVQHAEAATEAGRTCRGLHFQPRQNLPHLSGCSVTKRAQGKTSVSGRKKPPDHTMQSKDGWDSCNSCHRKARSCATCHATMRMHTILVHTLRSTRTTSFSRRTKRCAMPPSPKECPQYLQELRHTAVTFIHIQHGVPAPLLQIVSAWLPSQRRLFTSAASFSLTSWPLSPCPKPSGADTLLLAPSRFATQKFHNSFNVISTACSSNTEK